MLEKEYQLLSRFTSVFSQLPENDKNFLIGLGEGMLIKTMEQGKQVKNQDSAKQTA